MTQGIPTAGTGAPPRESKDAALEGTAPRPAAAGTLEGLAERSPMKAHSLRRTFWFANLALGAAVVAIAAWYFTDVKAAVGQVMDRKASPPWSQEALDHYKGMPVDVNPIEVAVKEADIKRVILRPDDYEKRNYWNVFSGLHRWIKVPIYTYTCRVEISNESA